MTTLSKEALQALNIARRAEITEYHVYNKLADVTQHTANANILRKIAREEKKHYEIWSRYFTEPVGPDRLRIWKYYLLARLLGVTFAIKLMEKKEASAQKHYTAFMDEFPEAVKISAEEKEHELQLIGMIDEERLKYVGSMVLGLNDALIELTGSLAGFTLAFNRNRLIAMIGLITGISAALSMSSSEYLSTKHEEQDKNPLKAALYTGVAYVFVVALLVSPYLLVEKPVVAFALTISFVILIVAFFTYYLSIAKDLSFGARFGEMLAISGFVALVSFGIGYAVRMVLGVDI